MKVFWSWQSDYLPKECRHFIKDALEDAVKKVGEELEIEDAERPELDHDTKGEAGMVDISETILRKISESAVFVADLTPIGQSKDGKLIPNPNVCIELGWAMQKLGIDRMIVVFNTAGGCTADTLPFDIRHRRLMPYNLPEKADKPMRAKVKKQLVQELTEAIRTNLEEYLKETSASTEISGVPANPKDPSIWESYQGKIVHINPLRNDKRITIRIPEGPRSYIRVIPSGWRNGQPSIKEIENAGNFKVDPISHGYTSGSFGRCEEGFVNYWFNGETAQGIREPANLSLFFDNSGEFWTLHGSVIHNDKGNNFLSGSWLLRGWAQAVRQSLAFFDHFDALPTRKIKIGLFGLRNSKLFVDYNNTPLTLSNEYSLERTERDWSVEVQLLFLTEAFNGVLDLFGIEKVDGDEAKRILNS